MVNGRTHWGHIRLQGGERAGYRRTVGFKVDRGGKGKRERAKDSRGDFEEKGDLSLSLLL